MSEIVWLLNKLTSSDLFRWYGYELQNVFGDIVYICDRYGRQYKVSQGNGRVSVCQVGNTANHAKAKWIARVLNGASLECEAGQ